MTSEIIKIILEKMLKNPAVDAVTIGVSPTVITPSLTPRPIGVINERYPAKRAKTKNEDNVKLRSKLKFVMERQVIKVAKPKTKKVSVAITVRVIFWLKE